MPGTADVAFRSAKATCGAAILTTYGSSSMTRVAILLISSAAFVLGWAADTSADDAMRRYIGDIMAKVRSNLSAPKMLSNDRPIEADIEQLPTGEIISIRVSRSSGDQGVDRMVVRAIMHSSPLPAPPRPELFSRTIKLTFRSD